MASEGPLYDSAGSNNTGVGTEAWASTTNIGADDGSNATITLASAEQSNYLQADNLGFNVADSVDGITVEIQRRVTSGLADCRDHVVKLSKDGSAAIGTNKADTATAYTTTATTITYGGAADLWGTTWLASEINATTFAVLFSCKDADTGASVQVDFIRVTVNYTAIPPEDPAAAKRGRMVKTWRMTPEPELVW